MRTVIIAALALFATPSYCAGCQLSRKQMAARFEAPPPGWEMPRTEWGDPDLRGKWPIDYLGRTPRERAPAIGTRAFLTDEEYAARLRPRR